MSRNARITLKNLHCNSETEGGSEPYIWPVLLRIDDQTLSTAARVDVTAPILGDARVVIQSDMRDDETADIPTSVGVLTTRLGESGLVSQLILIVALWNENETPDAAVGAGFQAFANEIRATFGNIRTLLELNEAVKAVDDASKALAEAEGAGDPEALRQAQEVLAKAEAHKDQVIKPIQNRISDRVRSSIMDSLSLVEQIEVLAGSLDIDQPVASSFTSFSTEASTDFVMKFGKVNQDDYEIRGRLEIQEVQADPCQSQVNAVINAQSAVNTVNAQLKSLQDSLDGAAGQDKAIILADIRNLRLNDLPLAKAALDKARAALAACRATA